jgi:hypothetical protein
VGTDMLESKRDDDIKTLITGPSARPQDRQYINISPSLNIYQEILLH